MAGVMLQISSSEVSVDETAVDEASVDGASGRVERKSVNWRRSMR